ncbi:MAG: acyl carrier protein [Akkermansia sp.]|nr:acyl carrier protein [Akkermansia sp.]
MDTTQFLELMQETLDIETELTLDMKFRELDEWDSLAYLSTIAMIDDEYDVVINANEFKTLETLGDIAKAIEARQ